MAKLRGGSTVGGKQVVTLDVMNKFIYQIQTAELKTKMKKAETDSRITDFATATTFIKDHEKNGLWQVNNGANSNGMYSYGQLLNFSNTEARLQIYAPHKEGDNSAMYFRTGWSDDIRSWERIATKTMLDAGLDGKYDKTGGNINGDISASGYVRSMSNFALLDSNGVRSTVQAFNNTEYRFTSGGIYSYGFDQPLYARGGLFVRDYEGSAGRAGTSEVWHEGNLTPSDYMKKDSQELSSGTNMDTIKEPGFYRCNTPTNIPTLASGWVYIEVIKHSSTYVLQKIYSYNGGYAFFRTLENGTWRSWKSMTGVLSKTIELTANSWTLVDGTYEASVTHNLNSDNISSVILTDSNKVSMFTGFQTTSSTTIKIFCATNTAGTVVINAIG